MRPAVKVAKIEGASRHSQLETEPTSYGEDQKQANKDTAAERTAHEWTTELPVNFLFKKNKK